MRGETAANDAAELSGGLPHTNVRDIPGPHLQHPPTGGSR